MTWRADKMAVLGASFMQDPLWVACSASDEMSEVLFMTLTIKRWLRELPQDRVLSVKTVQDLLRFLQAVKVRDNRNYYKIKCSSSVKAHRRRLALTSIWHTGVHYQ